MFSHIFFGANDVEQSKIFYDAVLGALGHAEGVYDDRGRCFYRTETGVFGLTQPIDGEPATHANGGTLGFAAKTPAEVDAWHRAGLANGGAVCENPPGIRDHGARKFYSAYLRDPAGNKICALHRIVE